MFQRYWNSWRGKYTVERAFSLESSGVKHNGENYFWQVDNLVRAGRIATVPHGGYSDSFWNRAAKARKHGGPLNCYTSLTVNMVFHVGTYVCMGRKKSQENHLHARKQLPYFDWIIQIRFILCYGLCFCWYLSMLCLQNNAIKTCTLIGYMCLLRMHSCQPTFCVAKTNISTVNIIIKGRKVAIEAFKN